MVFSLIQNANGSSVIFSDTFDNENIAGALTELMNWNVTRGTVDIAHDGDGIFGTEPDKWYLSCDGNAVDMDGSTPFQAGRMESKTLFSFETGLTYMLTYQLSGSQRPYPDDIINVSITNNILTISQLQLSYDAPWEEYNYQFTVDSPVQGRIVFDHAGYDNVGMWLDNVKLSVVPIPNALVLLASGIIGLAGTIFKRKINAGDG
jgi:hypothetical protein